MSISSVSFWQQDQNWQNQQQSNNNAFFSVMQSALTDQTTGMASIANQAAIKRVNSQIVSLLTGGTSSSSSAGSGSNSSVPAARPQPDVVPLQSSAANVQSGSTAASLLSGEIPIGSILSVLA